jgi:hypothetical protein
MDALGQDQVSHRLSDEAALAPGRLGDLLFKTAGRGSGKRYRITRNLLPVATMVTAPTRVAAKTKAIAA